MVLDRDYSRTLNSVLAGTNTLYHSVLPLSSNTVPDSWNHVTKIDPEATKQFPLLYPLYLQHTDAISVGGSSDVTGANTEETFRLLDFVSTPSIHEPSEARHVTETTREKATILTIPEVLNGGSEALVGTLGVGIEYLKDEMVPAQLIDTMPRWTPSRIIDSLSEILTSWLLRMAVFEAYIIQNPESAAAKQGGVSREDVLTSREAKQRALAADLHLRSEIIYIEYSGTFGGQEAVDILTELEGELSRARVWYGGGINSRKKAIKMLDAGADAIVVGDVFHRIAAEERALYSEIEDELNSNDDQASVSNWIEANVRVEDTEATQYLSTIPEIDEPTSLARQYIRYSLTLQLLLNNGIEPEQYRHQWSEGYSTLVAAISGDEDPAMRYLAQVAACSGGNSESKKLPVAHLSLAETGGKHKNKGN